MKIKNYKNILAYLYILLYFIHFYIKFLLKIKKSAIISIIAFAGMAKLADALALGASGEIHMGSSPFTRTIN